ncbi:hypothetical protein RHSIM_RhsimUnG0131000 [Rhododendron simsii]|uniref:Uncharacterized protein n=1 Tax=Rhododendron simsii TaxID=118357 RepID=A0A834FX11_RHOSS|nr:hypothetical protein RHSIM_RhsimUnG0131000 [Rhododendron simsii]
MPVVVMPRVSVSRKREEAVAVTRAEMRMVMRPVRMRMVIAVVVMLRVLVKHKQVEMEIVLMVRVMVPGPLSPLRHFRSRRLLQTHTQTLSLSLSAPWVLIYAALRLVLKLLILAFHQSKQAAFFLDIEFHPPKLVGRRPPPPSSSHSVTLVLLDIDVSWLAYWNFSLTAYNTDISEILLFLSKLDNPLLKGVEKRFELACITRGPLYLVFTLHVALSILEPPYFNRRCVLSLTDNRSKDKTLIQGRGCSLCFSSKTPEHSWFTWDFVSKHAIELCLVSHTLSKNLWYLRLRDMGFQLGLSDVIFYTSIIESGELGSVSSLKDGNCPVFYVLLLLGNVWLITMFRGESCIRRAVGELQGNLGALY